MIKKEGSSHVQISSEHPLIFVHGDFGLGGAEVLRVTVMKELSKRQIPFRLCILRESMKNQLDSVKALDIPIDCLKIKANLSDFSGCRRLSEYLREKQPAVVQSSQFLTNLHSVAAASKASVPLIISEEHGLYTWKKWYHRWLDRRACKKVDRIITCSHAVAEHHRSIVNAPGKKLVTIHNCVDDETLTNQAEAQGIRSELGLSADTQLYGTVGTLRWEKGHRTLIDAWRRFEVNQPDARLLIVGAGPLERELKAETNDLDSIHWLGSRNNVGAILKDLDCFLFPSTNEGLGIALLEAMYFELPVIASDSGGIPEIVRDGETGLVFPKGDAAALHERMVRLNQEPELKRRLATSAKQWVEKKHLPPIYCDQLMQVWGLSP